MRVEGVEEHRSRLGSLDTYRGLAMLLMMGEVLRFCEVAAARPGSAFWAFLCRHQSHVPWVGSSLHDLIQPSFSFLVGAALPFSLARRRAAGHSDRRIIRHAFGRAGVLVLLGIALRYIDDPQHHFTFVDTLTQIGLGYGFLSILGLRPARDQWVALGLILVGYWAAFAAYPLAAPGFDHAGLGAPAEWPQQLTGFAAHWNKNSNLARAFDLWFLNLFPRWSPSVFDDGGYATLSFVPTLGTMILGLLAGGVLRSADRTPSARVRWLVAAGLLGLLSGWLLGATGICPVVKRIWTPSFTLFSGGWCLLFLAACHSVIDLAGFRRWTFPFVVIGTNSIAAYCLNQLFADLVATNLNAHLNVAYNPLLGGTVALLMFWLVLFGMHRRRIFLRI
jgi:heparan-alpha-glucosaminide N-acetyltransferase